MTTGHERSAERPRILVVGAGPAGLRAAETLAAANVETILVDRNAAVGGKAFAQPPDPTARDSRALYGDHAQRALSLFAAFAHIRNRIDWRPEVAVWAVEDGRAHLVGPRGGTVLRYDRVVLATGVNDGIVPVKGWTLPGVHGLVAADRQLKTTGEAIGKRVAFIGGGPLLAPVARLHARAGVRVAALVDAAPPGARPAAWRALASSLRERAALALSDIPVHAGALPVEILGDDRVEAVVIRRADGALAEIRCDAVALGFGLRAESGLAEGAGARFDFDETRQHWLARADDAGRLAGVRGVYVAWADGDLAAAEAAGRRAALAVMTDLGDAHARHELSRLTRKARAAAHTDHLMTASFAASSALAQTADDDTPLCRCARVSVGAFREAADKGRVGDLERVARLTAVGLGACQGRMCASAAAAILAAEARTTTARVGRLPHCLPATPVTIATATTAGDTMTSRAVAPHSRRERD